MNYERKLIGSIQEESIGIKIFNVNFVASKI